MSLLLSLLFIAGISASADSINNACTPSSSSCDFYVCKEKEMNCGRHGYWSQFGYPFCQKFLKDEKQFSDRSQTWLQEVRLCLQERAQEDSRKPYVGCETLETEALHSHVDCYVDTGFCDLNFTEQLRVYWYLRSALRNPQTWREAQLLHETCRSKGSMNPYPSFLDL